MDSNINNDINDAIRNGISGEAVSATVTEFLNKEDTTPRQLKTVVSSIVEMKSDKPDQFNSEYASELVKNNSNRIKESLSQGIEPAEIASEIAKTSMDSKTDKGMKKYNFITKLISKMKKKQRKIDIEKQQMAAQMQNENPDMEKDMGGIQKVYTYTNNNQN